MAEYAPEIVVGSLTEAAHEAARIAYPLTSELNNGEIMGRRGRMIADGPLAVASIENHLRIFAKQQAEHIDAKVAEGVASMEAQLAAEEAFYTDQGDNNGNN